MKKWTIFISIIIVGISAFFYFFPKKNNLNQSLTTSVLSKTDESSNAPSPIKLQEQSLVITIDKTPIRISWEFVNPEKIDIHSNLIDKKLSEEIWKDSNCKTLANGGFYTKENTHLGLFVENYYLITPKIESSTLNGFFWIDKNVPNIEEDFLNALPRIAIQSGPILFLNGKPQILSINNDEPNRRIVAAITSDRQLIFLAFYRDGEIYQGPLLEEMPKIIDLFKKQINIDIIDAINLDGGSASFFVSKYERLNELKYVGSYFCEK